MSQGQEAEVLAEAVVAQNKRMDDIEAGSKLSEDAYLAIVAAAERIRENSERLRADVNDLLERVKSLESQVSFTADDLQ